MGHGLVPDLEPLPKYPGAQRHWFCEEEISGLRLLLGHSFSAPATHHELLGHAVQISPSRKYPASHIHEHDVSVSMPELVKWEWVGDVQGVWAEEPEGHAYPMSHTVPTDTPAPQYIPATHWTPTDTPATQ